MGGIQVNINLSNIFLDLSPKAMAIKAKINKWHQIKLKGFCADKETISKTTKCTEWEKILVNDMLNNGLISKIYKQLIHLIIKKTNNSIKKWAKHIFLKKT